MQPPALGDAFNGFFSSKLFVGRSDLPLNRMKYFIAALLASSSVWAGQARIAQREFGKDWPFSVSDGILSCDGNAVTFRANGVIYAVNGTATMWKRGIDIDKIWLPGEPLWITDPQTGKRVNAGPPKKNIGAIINRGLALCSK